VEVLVLSVDMAARRLALSVKQLLPDPWQEVGRRYQIGQMVRGIVTSVTDFGAFVEIEKGIEGLIHVSELAEGALLHPRSVIWEGKEVWARIVSLDPANHRMGLSMRQISGGEAAGPWAGIPSDTA
jgi:small subunit ribosomal protein S1